MKKAPRTASSLFQRSALWAAMSLSILGSAQALTLNRPIVQSKQGEALRAEIDISEISNAEQNEFQANLASQDIYKAAQIEVPLSNGVPVDIQVQLLRRDNGRLFLKISSKQAIQSNSLDLLIDLRWATGRLLRDVSLSIDDGRLTAKPVASSAMAVQPTSNTAQTSQQIVVKRGDTASELAAQRAIEGASLEQMLVALLRSNPDAFVASNVNRMKEGALLTLPTEQEAKLISKEEARREISVQAIDFEAYRSELAARAPGGTLPKAARDVTGKLDAKVQNKNAKTNQDKLTLAKPASKDAAAEDKIAQQREAQDVATRAAELSRNIAELGKIAAATVSDAVSPASQAASEGVLPVTLPASAATTQSEWLDDLRNNSLTPVWAGGLIALLVLVGLWLRRGEDNAEDNIEGLPPLNVKFNLDLPEHGPHDNVERAYIHDVATHAPDTHAHDDDLQEELHTETSAQPVRHAMEMPDISLDLDNLSKPSPYQVRIDLADELWNLGQLHTSRALMEEVANEASGAEQQNALKWLAERG